MLDDANGLAHYLRADSVTGDYCDSFHQSLLSGCLCLFCFFFCAFCVSHFVPFCVFYSVPFVSLLFVPSCDAMRVTIFGKLANTVSPTIFILSPEILSIVSSALCQYG